METKTEVVHSVRDTGTQLQVTLGRGGYGICLPPSARGMVEPGDELRITYSTRSRTMQPGTVLRVSKGKEALPVYPH